MLIAKLSSRKLLRISGPDTYSYLQGLLSNDVRNLYKKSTNCISSFILNSLGRVMCDLLLYRTPNTRNECQFTPPGQAKINDELLIECDTSYAQALTNMLMGYRVRRNINVNIEENLKVWCIFKKLLSIDHLSKRLITLDEVDSSNNIVNNQLKPLDDRLKNYQIEVQNELVTNDLLITRDPRLSTLGLRILSNHDSYGDLKSVIESKLNIETKNVSEKQYFRHRYSLGVGEGPDDHPESDCFPLECNGAWLNYVSFDKGCYLGQELTARIHHTGVVRKRLMPIFIDNPDIKTDEFLPGSELLDDKDNKVGNLRKFSKSNGLALIRVDQAMKSKYLTHHISGTKINAFVPYWWNIN